MDPKRDQTLGTGALEHQVQVDVRRVDRQRARVLLSGPSVRRHAVRGHRHIGVTRHGPS